MNKKYWLIVIIFVVVTAITVVLYWFLTYGYDRFMPSGPKNFESGVNKTSNISKTKQVEGRETQSIPLEKPPFLK